MNTPASFYESVGGEETFHLIVHRFYERMRNDDLIGPMYPDDDWEGAEDRLRWFLAQYWGGPQTFSENRGHPRLRMRHAHFPIGMNEAQRWLDIMSDTLDSIDEATLPQPTAPPCGIICSAWRRCLSTKPPRSERAIRFPRCDTRCQRGHRCGSIAQIGKPVGGVGYVPVHSFRG